MSGWFAAWLVACGAPATPSEPVAVAAPAGGRPEASWPATFAGERDAVDKRISFLRAQLEKRPDQPTRWGTLIEELCERARLTGELADWTAADDAVKAAKIANPNRPPTLAKANLDFSLHRFDAAAAAVEGVADAQALRAAIALARGDYASARTGFEAAHAREPTYTTASQLAVLAWRTGDPTTAEALFRDAQRRYHGRSHRPRAWLHLQLGLLDLDAGRWDAARAHYADADAAMSGWWLVREHRAEVERLAGRPEVARPLYEALIAETGNPEFMDALARTFRDLGDEPAAAAWIAHAESAFEARLVSFPEATWGHALEHYLELSENQDRMLELAEKNHALRPDGAAALQLARAWLRLGRREEAQVLVAAVRASPWRSPDLEALEATLR